MNVEVRHLRYFLAVAHELHFGRAAARLQMSQPPLSQAIAALEAELGVELFERTTRRVELTAAGAEYRRHAQTVLAAMHTGAQAARDIAAGAQGRLVIGCVGSATYSLLPAFARWLRHHLPRVETTIKGEMLTAAQVEALGRHEIDVAIMRPPTPNAPVVHHLLRQDQLMVALPAQHRLSQAEQVRLSQLNGERLVGLARGQGSRLQPVVTHALAQAKVEVAGWQEVSETSTQLTFVAAGAGIAIVPAPAQGLRLDGIVWKELTPAISLPLVVAHRRGDEPLAQRAARALRDHLDALAVAPASATG